MKKFFTLTIFVMVLLLNGCRDRAVTPEQLPHSIITFIQQNFPDEKLTYAESERKLTGKVYEIVLSGGTRIDFETNGEWDKIEGTLNNPVPVVVLTESIVNYIQTNFPDAMIIKVERDSRGYEVELSNGLELKFNKQGALTNLDD